MEFDINNVKNKVYTLYVKSYEDKNKIVEGLVNSGYTISAELAKETIGFVKTKGWKVDIYQ